MRGFYAILIVTAVAGRSSVPPCYTPLNPTLETICFSTIKRGVMGCFYEAISEPPGWAATPITFEGPNPSSGPPRDSVALAQSRTSDSASE
jgi:hypothetical protein